VTAWIFVGSRIALWVLGLIWSWGFITCGDLHAEMYPTRIRGVGNGFSWAVAVLVGAVLWPFVSAYLHQTTGSFAAAFLLTPVILLALAGIVWFYSPEHARKELDQISV
jgi:MFS family permease